MAKHNPKTRQRPQSGTPWEPSDLQSVGFLAAMTAVFFLKILLGNAHLWEDFVYQWYPFRQYAASALASGEIPLWNPYTVNGMPFLAEIQTEVFYLPMLALTLFVKSGRLDVYWLELVNVLHYFLAGAGMYLLARSFSLRRMSALVAGATFAFSGFLVTHAIHQVITGVAAWYPLLLFMMRKALQEKTWTWVFIGAVALGHSFFAGSPQMSLFFYFFLAAYVAFEIVATVGWRGVITRPGLLLASRAAVLVVLSLGILMIQFLPTQELSALSARASITYEKATEGSLGWGQILTVLVPKFFGVSDAHAYTYWGPGPYWHYWETSIYFGVAPLLLGLFSLRFFRSNRYVAFFSLFALFALLFALGKNFPLHGLFFDYVPGFASFRNPGRMGVFVAFTGSLLAAFGFDALWKVPPGSREQKAWSTTLLLIGGAAAGLILLCTFGAFDRVFPFLTQPQSGGFVHKELLVALALVVASTLVLVGLVRRILSPALMGLAFVAIIFIDLYVAGAEQNTAPQDPEAHFAQAATTVRYLKAQEGLFRVNTRNSQGMIMDRNQGLMDRIFTMEGYTPLVLQRIFPPANSPDNYFDLQNIRYYLYTDSARGTIGLRERPGYLQRAHMVYATVIARNEEEVRAHMTDPAFDPRAVAIVEDTTARPLAGGSTTPVWTAQVTDYKSNTITIAVNSDRDGFLVLSEAYYPGWRAFVDGTETPVYRTNYVSRGMPVPAGSHTVIVEYQPATFTLGAWLSVATLALCCAGVVIGIRSSRRDPQTT